MQRYVDHTDATGEASRPFHRKLAAILSVDVQGYSRLMELDEDQTVKTIKAYRKILARIITNNQGRVIDAPGDNLLAEFASAVHAVQSAIIIQSEIKQQNSQFSDDRQMLLRIGVNLGDVIADGQRIYGDGVNIAARMESMANGGGICISGNVYDQIQNKMSFGCTYLGQRAVKNIRQPVRVYQIWEDPEARECRTRFNLNRRIGRTRYYVSAALGLVVVIAAAMWFSSHSLLPGGATSSVQNETTTQWTGQSSIAVLPFASLSADADNDYLADGITNDIITDLSRFKELSVASSNSVFRFKGKAVDVVQIGRQLNVAFILEGSIQTDGKQVRINAQLIDTANGKHLWATRFDRELVDLINLQNDLIKTTVRKLALNIDQIERGRALAKKTEKLNAYDNYLRGYHFLYQRTREGQEAAKNAFTNAIAIDPDFGSAYMGLASVRILDAAYGYTEFRDIAMSEAETLLKKTIAMDESNAEARAKLGYVYMRRGAFELAKSELNKALDLNPNNWRNYRVLAPVLLYSGDPGQALKWYLASLEYDPYLTPGLYMNVGICYYLMDQYDLAIQWLTKGVAKWPDFLGSHIVLASIYAHIDQPDKAEEQVKHILRISPFFELQFYGGAFRNAGHRSKLVEGLRKAGLS